MTPIIINGVRPFSLYRYKKKDLYFLLISRDGIRIINSICNDIKIKEELRKRLFLYLHKHMVKKYPEELEIIRKFIPYIVEHYVLYRDGSMYDLNMCRGRYLCFFHNIDNDLISGLSVFLNKIVMTEDCEIMKSKIEII